MQAERTTIYLCVLDTFIRFNDNKSVYTFSEYDPAKELMWTSCFIYLNLIFVTATKSSIDWASFFRDHWQSLSAIVSYRFEINKISLRRNNLKHMRIFWIDSEILVQLWVDRVFLSLSLSLFKLVTCKKTHFYKIISENLFWNSLNSI